jgi:hypothetical protein
LQRSRSGEASRPLHAGTALETTVHGLLLLDGVEVAAVRTTQHLCTAAPVGCAASARVLSLVARWS